MVSHEINKRREGKREERGSLNLQFNFALTPFFSSVPVLLSFSLLSAYSCCYSIAPFPSSSLRVIPHWLSLSFSPSPVLFSGFSSFSCHNLTLPLPLFLSRLSFMGQ